MLTRRGALGVGLASGLGTSLFACGPSKGPACPISWIPSLATPVLYGYKDYVACGNAVECLGIGGNQPSAISQLPPPNVDLGVRVYYPSLEDSPNGATFLVNCWRCPLVIFVHGHCTPDAYAQWVELPSQLARAGYVVAVTSYGGVELYPGATNPLVRVHDWLRNEWEYNYQLLPAPNTAVMGHSYGGPLAAQLAAEIPVMAFASLSGEFLELDSYPSLLAAIKVPSLFFWDDQHDDDGANLMNGSALTGGWSLIQTPKHLVVFQGGRHGAYLEPGTAGICNPQGSCNSVRPLAADFVTTFLSKYMPPYEEISSMVGDSLIVRPQDLPPLIPPQSLYSGSFLTGFAVSKASTDASKVTCAEYVSWQTAAGNGSTYLVHV